MKKEECLQIAVCNYLRLQYPKVLFTCDLASGMKLTMFQAVKAKKMRSGCGWPDIFIAKPTSKYSGLFIELKKEGERIYKKDGSPASDHISNQIEMHKELLKNGYAAVFAVGFESAKMQIDHYLNVYK